MIIAKVLLADLQKLLTQLEDDIRRRCETLAEVDAPLRAQYAAAKAANRTAQAYDVWRDEQITQAGVAWILGCVFVRFCEDNRLIDPPRLSGPVEGGRRKRAEDEHTLYFQQHPTHSDREYLLWVFELVAQLPAMKELFDKRHNPLWALGVSGDGAMLLYNFWLNRDAATGLLVHDFADPAFAGPTAVTAGPTGGAGQDPTRFLGDMYQDLSESARKKYALLQTPVFVEEFILDRTLTPAIGEFGFQQVRLIDPTCGSGHFLLGAFHRLFDLWVKHEPATSARVLAQRALDSVYGVDLNPYAVAIARFRLLVAALRACDIHRLADAPGFTIHLAAGDSLLHGPRPDVIGNREPFLIGEDPLGFVYDTEDAPLLRRYLGQQYHAVVGNPPYITPKDKALNEEYRRRFGSCHMKYSLSVPFFQRFFDLCLNADSPGFVGMITSNSFMKREFGKKLIEQYIPRWDLTHVIDTGGAYIPGHGTPTVIIFGRNRRPATTTIRTVMGISGEPSIPSDPAKGLVWSAILDQIDHPGSQSDFVSVANTAREVLRHHPWSIGGGGAAELKVEIEMAAVATLGSLANAIGFMAIPGEDDVFVMPGGDGWLRRWNSTWGLRPFVIGENIRDWEVTEVQSCIYPYADDTRLFLDENWMPHLWLYRTILRNGMCFGQTREERGLDWREYGMLVRDKFGGECVIAFAEVATHNHGVLEEGNKIYKNSAQIIKLPNDTSKTEYLGILGLLNSSVSCFWLKQVCHNKGSTVDQKSARQRTAAFEDFYAFNATKLLQFPLTERKPISLASRLHSLANAYPYSSLKSEWVDRQPGERLRQVQGEMISLQEELDWQCYRLYGFLPGDGTPGDYEVPGHNSPPIELGQRAFEIVLARNMAAGDIETTWFERHGSTPITEMPADWPEEYKQVVRRRIEIIETDKNIALIEKPEYKRRWNTEPWDEMQERALRSWLLDRLEGWPVLRTEQLSGGAVEQEKEPEGPRSLVWDEREGGPRLMSVAQLADLVRQDKDFMQVAALYRGREEGDFDMTNLVAELVDGEAVPFLPVLRYKELGRRNRRVWEMVWDLQRKEDAIDARTKLPPTDPQYLTEDEAKEEKKAMIEGGGDIPVPPKYKSSDMLNSTIWRLRGKLDVPKERFVSFPHCQRDSDPTLVITWAGFDHLQQMQALAAYYMEMKEKEGWPPDRRVPLLAGMLELLPWVLQWHNDLDPTHQLRMGDYYRDFVNDEAREMGKTPGQLREWKPNSPASRRASSRGN